MNIRVAHSAVQALGHLGFPAAPSHFDQAVKSWQWPGRYQLVPGAPPVLLDGAHNPHALEALFGAIKSDPAFSSTPIHTVVSTLKTKSTGEMLELIQSNSASLHLCPTSVDRSLSAEELGELTLEGSHVYASPKQAFEKAKARAGETGLVLITGSLFLVADILYLLEGQTRDPPIAS
jgi:dihydrofolate synthase/folylpolyglutamate synthase